MNTDKLKHLTKLSQTIQKAEQAITYLENHKQAQGNDFYNNPIIYIQDEGLVETLNLEEFARMFYSRLMEEAGSKLSQLKKEFEEA